MTEALGSKSLRFPLLKSGWGLLLWLIAAAAMTGTAVLLISLFSARPATRFVRYVSPPLQDGSRVTFLYPAALSDVTFSAGPLLRDRTGHLGDAVEEVDCREHIAYWQSLVRRKSLTRQIFHQEGTRQIDVMVTRNPFFEKAFAASYPAGAPKPSGVPGYVKAQTLFQQSGGIFGMTWTGTRSGMQYYLLLSCGNGLDNATVANSFGVVPPGAS